jgi:ribosome-binding factor A
MHKDTGRTRKIGELLQRELAVLIARELNDPRVTQVTLTAVDVAPDMSHAKVFITHLGGEEAALKAVAGLNHAAGFLRHVLSERVILRQVPALRFVYDESVERGDNIERLLARARREQDDKD